MRSITSLTLALFCALAIAEETSPGKTALEAFNARSGAVLIKGFSEVAVLEFKGPSTVTIEAREMTDAGTGEKQFGITIEVKQTARLERKETSYVDEAEIDSLIAGIDYIAKVEKTATKLSNIEAVYKTKGDLAITVFSSAQGKMMAAVTSGRIGAASAFMDLAELVKVKNAIVTAKELINSLKQ
jgi:hypothetical protein